MRDATGRGEARSAGRGLVVQLLHKLEEAIGDGLLRHVVEHGAKLAPDELLHVGRHRPYSRTFLWTLVVLLDHLGAVVWGGNRLAGGRIAERSAGWRPTLIVIPHSNQAPPKYRRTLRLNSSSPILPSGAKGRLRSGRPTDKLTMRLCEKKFQSRNFYLRRALSAGHVCAEESS